MHNTVKTSLNEIGLKSDGVSDQDSLFDRGLDSLMTVLLIAKLEEKLGKNLNLNDFSQDKFESINSIVSFIESSDSK